MCDFQNVRCAKVRRAHPDIPNVAELDKNVFKTSEISVILISLKNEEKKIEREKRKKAKKARYKKSGEISEEHFIHHKVCEKKISQKNTEKSAQIKNRTVCENIL